MDSGICRTSQLFQRAAKMARIFSIFLILGALFGCSAYQPTKNVWKGTKQLWATYVSPPAYVDYDDKGELSPQAEKLARAMLGVDNQLSRLERVMHNADRPPTREWLERLFANFSWLSGFAGVKYDGSILGQQPETPLKELDFNYLLHEDAKQKSRALRADVQPSPLGPEVMLAAPLYDGVDFLGIVVAYFDMRGLMTYSENPQDFVVLTPTALLWPGKYDFAATPLPGVDWAKVVRESSHGTCSNSTGTFFYMVRYLANLPMIFAVPQSGDFPEGNGGLEQGYAFFPPEREKGTPPPVSEERLKKEELAKAERERQAAEAAQMALPQETATASGSAPNELQPGSRDSVLLKERRAQARRVEERQLEGENVQVERVNRPRRRPAPALVIPDEVLTPTPKSAPPAIQRPSPFGPREEERQPTRPSPFGPKDEETQAGRPSPFGSPDSQESAPARSESASPGVESGATDASVTSTGGQAQEEAPRTPSESAPAEEIQRPATLPGGRPSPFGPR